MGRTLLTPRYMHAVEVAALLFRDRHRDMGDVPYITHLIGVCHVVEQMTDDEDVVIAALMHDTLEDIPAEQYSAERLGQDFGYRVLGIVQTVSLDEKRFSKTEARRRYLRQLQEGPIEACLVSGADMLHNGRDIIDWCERDPTAARARFYTKRSNRRSWFWRTRYRIIRDRLGSDHVLVAELAEIIQALEQIGQITVQFNEEERQ